MSVYYIVGSNKELKNLSKLNVGFEPISSDDLKKYLKNIDFKSKYYYVSNFIMSTMIYDDVDKSLHYNFNDQKTDLFNFAQFFNNECENLNSVEFYKLWSIFDNHKENHELNYIYNEREIDIDDYNYLEEFEFNSKYIFNRKKENNLELWVEN